MLLDALIKIEKSEILFKSMKIFSGNLIIWTLFWSEVLKRQDTFQVPYHFLIENVCEKDYFEVLNKISTWLLLNHRECGVGQMESFCV